MPGRSGGWEIESEDYIVKTMAHGEKKCNVTMGWREKGMQQDKNTR
jgi:hypothetical protein